MKIEECKMLKKGAKVRFALGGGYFQIATYQGMEQVTSYGKTTIEELMDKTKNLFEHGRKEWRAVVEYEDRGRMEQITIRPSRLKKVNE